MPNDRERTLEASSDFELLRMLLEDVANFERERAIARAEAREKNLGLWSADAAALADQRALVVDEALAPIPLPEAPAGVEAIQLDLTSRDKSPSTDDTRS
jgi:hypothetical protein